MYNHLLAYPMGNLKLKNMADKIKYVQFLHDASEINFRTGSREESKTVSLTLPVLKPPVEIPVLEVTLK